VLLGYSLISSSALNSAQRRNDAHPRALAEAGSKAAQSRRCC